MLYCGKINRTNLQIDYLQKIYFEKSWAWWLNHMGTFVVFIIGFFGNMLCLIFLCRRPFIRNSYTQYLIALAIVDTGAIFFETITALDDLYQYQSKDRRALIQHTIVSCKLFYYIRFIFYSMSSWIVVALAVERLVAVKYPLWSKHICSVTNARRIILIMFLFTMAMQSYHLVIKGLDCSSSSKITTKLNCRCKTLLGYATIDIIFTIYIWRLVLMTLLPLIIIITVNILIMSKLFNKNCLIDHTNRVNNARRKVVLRYKVSRMLVIVSTIYLLFHLPGSTLEVVKFLLVHAFRLCDLKWQYYIYIAQDIFDLLTNFNYGINFYLYIISSKHVRCALIHKNSIFRVSTTRSKENWRKSKTFLSSYIYSSRKPHERDINASLAGCETVTSV
ncbi:unnamed protein product [Adineta steineri]|uniref:G-protein coupled receptors family 1 profile domain-containing protein n=1 Tax=Adineta steineri TaxID=433720 RepID=A0A815DCE1_9BILA|nr:unnamed protein product [Adineta steineri]